MHPTPESLKKFLFKSQSSISKMRICSPFKLFNDAFDKTHSHGHSGEQLSIETFNQFCYNPHKPLWFSIFIQDCIECQTNKQFPIKPNNISRPLPCSKNANRFKYRISSDTKPALSLSSHGNSYNFVIIDVFIHFVVTNPAPHISSLFAIQTALHHWITKFDQSQYLVTDRGTEYIIQDMGNLRPLFHVNHSPRTPYTSWTNGLVETNTFVNINLLSHIPTILILTLSKIFSLILLKINLTPF